MVVEEYYCITKNTLLRWLPAEQQISDRIASLIWRYLLDLTSVYLRELCWISLNFGALLCICKLF